MRLTPTSIIIAGVLLAAAAFSANAWAASSSAPCEQITAACQRAGFTSGGSNTGTGLRVHCVDPIMQGTAQPSEAKRPLPQVDPQLVASCKANNPRFGQAAQPTPTADVARAKRTAVGDSTTVAGSAPVTQSTPKAASDSDSQVLAAIKALSDQVKAQSKQIDDLQKKLDADDRQINGRLMVICITSLSAFGAAGDAAWGASAATSKSPILWGLPGGTGAFSQANMLATCTRSDAWKNSKDTYFNSDARLFTPFN
jgi:hypothetical protein